MVELDDDPRARKPTRLNDLQSLDDPPRHSSRAKPKKQKRKPPAPASANKPLGKGKVALGLAGAAFGGAVLNNLANKVVDKTSDAVAGATSRAIEKQREKQTGNSWKQAAKNVK